MTLPREIRVIPRETVEEPVPVILVAYRECAECKMVFMPKNNWQKFCGKKCAKNAYYRSNRKR